MKGRKQAELLELTERVSALELGALERVAMESVARPVSQDDFEACLEGMADMGEGLVDALGMVMDRLRRVERRAADLACSKSIARKPVWRSIETAPKRDFDKPILLARFCLEEAGWDCAWAEDSWWEDGGWVLTSDTPPTHWMELGEPGREE